MLYDCHTHSCLSSDSRTPMTDMADAARRMGVGITFTEHVDFGFPAPNVVNADLDRYIASYQKTRAAFPDTPVLLGVELGFEYGFEAQSEAYAYALCPDLIVNSVHSLDGVTLFCEEVYPPGLQHSTYARYLEKVLDSARLCRDYDVLGHIGFVSKRAQYPDPMLHCDEFIDRIDAILHTLIDSGHALEANTSGFRMAGDTLPEQMILKRYRELGGELLTIGSDAHSPEYVGFHFANALERIRACGFTHITHYEKRKAVMLPL